MEWITNHDIDGVFYIYRLYDSIYRLKYHSVFNL